MNDDAPHQMRWPRVVARVAGTVVLVPVLYVLSLGPVGYFLWARSPRLDRTLEWFYAPIDWMVWHYNLSRPASRYGKWWADLPSGPTERYLRKKPPLPASE